jgi:hypothetical protein
MNTPVQRRSVRAYNRISRYRTAISGSSAVVRVRRALLFYALKRLGLDTKPDARPPQQQHIVLVNAEEVKAWQPRLWET